MNLDDFVTENFFCEKSYEPITGSFYDLSPDTFLKAPRNSACNYCSCCERLNLLEQSRRPEPIHKITSENSVNYFKTVLFKHQEYSLGSFVYLKPETLPFETFEFFEKGMKDILKTF